MTRVPTIATEYLDPPLAGRRIEVRWTALLPPRSGRGRETGPAYAACRPRRVLVVTLEPVDARHALLEAWVETPGGIRDLVPRQPVAGSISLEDGLLHLDAHLDGRRVIALTVVPEVPGARDARPGRLLYAQSALLAAAGFPPGSCDPPTARLLASEQGAVPA